MKVGVKTNLCDLPLVREIFNFYVNKHVEWALPASSLHRVMGQGTPLSFSQLAIEILRSTTELSSLSWYFLSLGNLL